MRIAALFLLVGLLTGSVTAQDSPEAWLIPFAAAYQPQVGGFNQVFAAHGRPEAHSRHFGWGLELRSLSGSFLVGPMFFRTWDDSENEDYQLRTDATGIFGELGVKLVPLGFLTIVPLLGVGGLSQSFSLREKTGGIGFDTLFGSAPENLSLSPGMKLAGFGALELGLIASTKAGRFGLALRGGYIYSPFSLTWRITNGAPVTGTPDTHLGGPFFSAGLLMMPEPQTATSRE
jgi:hypothetical protein